MFALTPAERVCYRGWSTSRYAESPIWALIGLEVTVRLHSSVLRATLATITTFARRSAPQMLPVLELITISMTQTLTLFNHWNVITIESKSIVHL